MDRLASRDDNHGEQEGQDVDLAAPLLDRSAFSFFSQKGGGGATLSVEAGGNGSEEDGLEMVEKTQHPTLPHSSFNDTLGPPTQVTRDTKEHMGSGCFKNWKILLVATVVLASVAAAAFLFANSVPPPTSAPTASPTYDPQKEEERAKLRQTIVDAFGEEYFDNPQKKEALDWILYEDPRSSLEHDPKEENHPSNPIQRFALASIYFQSSAHSEWEFCGRPVDDTKAASCVYYEGFFSKKDESFAMRWLSKEHECQWMGVYCHAQHKNVERLSMNIYNYTFTGRIPTSELLQLTYLNDIDFSENNLTGPLPAALFQALPLTTVRFHRNKLTGSIPPQLFLSSSMGYISLSHNELTGSLPTEIGQFNGPVLGLSVNKLTGSIPEETYSAVKIKDLVLNDNLLTGTLSTAIGSLANLRDFDVSGNSIAGKIPSELGLLDLEVLKLERTNIEGTIPEELYKNKNWRYIGLNSSQLSGTISTHIGQLTKLYEFNIANNTFHGTLPTELASLPQLEILFLSGNGNLTGSIPKSFCSTPRVNVMHIQADCTPTASTGVPAMFCPKACCSTCCEAETGKCVEN